MKILIVFSLLGLIYSNGKIENSYLFDSKPIIETVKIDLVNERLYSEKFSNFLDDIQKIITILAICFGGLWTYFNFIKGRIYKPRLELNISANIINQNGVKYLATKISLKNLGLTQADIKKEGSALIISYFKNQDKITENKIFELIKWEEVAAHPVFTEHEWIEPNEEVEEEFLFLLHEKNVMSIKLRFRITSPKKIEWNKTKILTLE